MSDFIQYKQSIPYIKDLIVLSFKDKKIRWSFYFSLIGLTIGLLANLSIPLLLKNIVESFSSQNSLSTTLILISYALIWMIGQASLYIRALLSYKVEQRITLNLGIKVLSHLYNLSQSFFLNQKPGATTNIIRRAQQDVPRIIPGLFLHILPTILEFVFVIFLIYSLYPLIYSLLMIGILLAFFVYNSLSMKVVLKDREEANEIDMAVDGIVTDWISNYEAVKIFGKKDSAINACKTELKKREVAEVKFMKKYNIFRLGDTLILGLGLCSLTYLIGQGVLNGSMTVGDFVLFNGYILQFIIPIAILGQATEEVKKALIDLKGVLKLLETPSDIQEVSKPRRLSGSTFQIEFQNVTFKYKKRNILKNISFKIEPGETAIVVGPTGIGKSTIAKLILRLFDPTHGQILINNTNIKQFSLESLYNKIGWVPQETYLLNDTIENNMRFVRPEATPVDIEEALYNAHLHDFIKTLPEGLNTFVGDRGLKLSGGEKQRLSLARLFLKQPEICIFDECTSALDDQTTQIIQCNIEKSLKNKTKIIITHRPFMNQSANQIIRVNSLISQS